MFLIAKNGKKGKRETVTKKKKKVEEVKRLLFFLP